MKALSIKPPWGNLIKNKFKRFEIRTWKTNYRGDLLVVASQKFDEQFDDIIADAPGRFSFKFDELIYGKAEFVARLIDCRPMTKSDERLALCPFIEGLYAWEFDDIRPIKPFVVKGQLGLYEVDYYYGE